MEGKELITENSLLRHDYGARYYDAVLGRWFVQDAMADAGYGWSPYRYGFDNPVITTDPDGNFEDNYVFNENGEFVRKEENNEPDKIIIENSKTKEMQIIELNDPNYFKNIEKNANNRDINEILSHYKLKIIGNEQIESTIKNAGVKPMSFQKRYEFAAKESPAGGKIDFSQVIDSRTFAVVGNKAYDNYDYGNFLWGYAMHRLGFTYVETKASSEFAAWMWGKKWYDNGQRGTPYDSNAKIYQSQWWLQRTWTGDSPEDQKAIRDGFFFKN